MRPTRESDSAKQAINRFEGVRRPEELNMAVTTNMLTITASGAVTMLMMALIRLVVSRCEEC